MSTPRRLESIVPTAFRGDTVRLSDGRKQIRDDLFRMMRDTYKTRESYEIMHENKAKHQCRLRKRVLNNDER